MRDFFLFFLSLLLLLPAGAQAGVVPSGGVYSFVCANGIIEYVNGVPTCGVDDTGAGGVTADIKGDIQVIDPAANWVIVGDAVTNAKLANMATQRIKGRTTAGAGDPEDLTAAQVATLLDAEIATQAELGALVPATATALAVNPTDCAANQYANAIAASGNLTCAAIASADLPTAGATNAKLANMATQTIKGRTTAGSGVPEDLTATQVRTLINVANGADVTTNGTQTLANKTLTTPVIADLSNAQHTHAGAASGGVIPYLPLTGGTLTGNLTLDNLGVTFEASDTNPACEVGEYRLYADLSEAKLKTCTNGVAADIGGGAGVGDVTGPGVSTDTAVARFNGAGGTTLQNSGVTIDASNNVLTPGIMTATAFLSSGGASAGVFTFGEGTAPSAAGANTIQLQAPADVTTAYDLLLPPASTTGFLLGTNASNVSTLSFVGSTGTGNVARATAPTIDAPIITNGVALTAGAVPTCDAGNYGFSADVNTAKVELCENGVLTDVKVKHTTSADAPAVTDDAAAGYTYGSLWTETTSDPDVIYVCTDATVDAAVWQDISTSAAPATPSLQTVSDVGRHIGNANDVATALIVGTDDGDGNYNEANEGGRGWYFDPALGSVEFVTPAGDNTTDIAATFAAVWRYDGNEIARLTSTGWEFTGTARPVQSIEVDSFERAACSYAVEVFTANKPKMGLYTCTDSDADGFDFDFLTPANWDAGTVTVTLKGLSKNATPTGNVVLSCSGNAVSDGDVIPDKNETGQQNVTLGLATQYKEEIGTSAPITLNGTPAAGDHVYMHCDIDATLTTAGTTGDEIADVRIHPYVKVSYTKTKISE